MRGWPNRARWTRLPESACVARNLRGRPLKGGAIEITERELTLSIIVLQWDQLHLTRRCVDSIRANTDVPYELIIVDNGSEQEARSYGERLADRFIGNSSNLGFAVGMNQGLSESQGEWVAFVNNDTVLPPGWASSLLDATSTSDVPGIVCPAVTTAGNRRTVRSEPGTAVEVLLPFERPPSAIVWVMRTRIAVELGGFGEEFPIASGEDLDLAFKVWTNGLDIIFDHRVLVEHVGHGTSDAKLTNRRGLWIANRDQFLRKWQDPSTEVPRLTMTDHRNFARNRATAAAVAMSMHREVQARLSADDHKAKAADKESRIRELRRQLRGRRTQVDQLTEELDIARAEVRNLSSRLSGRDRKLEAMQARLEEARLEIEQLEAGVTEWPMWMILLDRRRWTGRVARKLWRATRWAIPARLRDSLKRRLRA